MIRTRFTPRIILVCIYLLNYFIKHKFSAVKQSVFLLEWKFSIMWQGSKVLRNETRGRKFHGTFVPWAGNESSGGRKFHPMEFIFFKVLLKFVFVGKHPIQYWSVLGSDRRSESYPKLIASDPGSRERGRKWPIASKTVRYDRWMRSNAVNLWKLCLFDLLTYQHLSVNDGIRHLSKYSTIIFVMSKL